MLLLLQQNIESNLAIKKFYNKMKSITVTVMKIKIKIHFFVCEKIMIAIEFVFQT